MGTPLSGVYPQSRLLWGQTLSKKPGLTAMGQENR
jgi:hypothetical protein